VDDAPPTFGWPKPPHVPEELCCCFALSCIMICFYFALGTRPLAFISFYSIILVGICSFIVLLILVLLHLGFQKDSFDPFRHMAVDAINCHHFFVKMLYVHIIYFFEIII
jgi:hypothetical protein